jgi:hypothetical protein
MPFLVRRCQPHSGSAESMPRVVHGHLLLPASDHQKTAGSGSIPFDHLDPQRHSQLPEVAPPFLRLLLRKLAIGEAGDEAPMTVWPIQDEVDGRPAWVRMRHPCATRAEPQRIPADLSGLSPVDPRWSETAQPSAFSPNGAAGEGFEPPNEVAPVAGFQDRCIQPLCHPAEGADVSSRVAPSADARRPALTRPGDARTLE